MSYYLKDPVTGIQSVSLTAFAAGFAVATIKLLLSGIAITGIVTFSQFTGVDFAAVTGALGTLYWARRTNNQGNSEDSPKS